jgi:uncharacterized membrane protein YgcG
MKKLVGDRDRGLDSFRKRGHSLMVKPQPSKLDTRVRFPLPAPNHRTASPASIKTMKPYLASLTAFAWVCGASALHAGPPADCKAIYKSVFSSVRSKPAEVLTIVTDQVKATPTCACEVIKASILASKPKPAKVGAIVGAAVTAAPAQADVIKECALEVRPDAAGEIDKALAGLGVLAGNPLDFPGDQAIEQAKDGKQTQTAGQGGQGGQGGQSGILGGPGGTGGPGGGFGGGSLIPMIPPAIINSPNGGTQVTNPSGQKPKKKKKKRRNRDDD